MYTETQSAASFSTFNFHPKISAAINAAGYSQPTPIQLKSIPSAIEGKDLLGLAQTGTGKTAAFALPLLHRLLAEGKTPSASRKVRALVMVPTRELAEQVQDSFRQLSKGTGIRTMTVYGGVSIQPQIRNLRNPPEIVIACPGRLLDHIKQRTVDLSGIEFLVLDEADHMFDMGFLYDIRQILKTLPIQRQTLMFSATMPPEIRKLALDILRNPVTIQADKGGTAKTVSHSLYPVKQDLKADLVLNLLNIHTDGSVLIFTRTKHRAKKLSERLAKEKHSATCLQGNLSQNRRQEAIEGFRKGSYRIMVATDIAARGIDVSSVSHVINYDIPNTVEAYTHRIGRTGRAAQTGTALTLITSEDEFMVKSIERAIGSKLQRNKLENFNYQAAVPEKSSEGSETQRPQRGNQQRHRRQRSPARQDRSQTRSERTEHPEKKSFGSSNGSNRRRSFSRNRNRSAGPDRNRNRSGAQAY